MWFCGGAQSGKHSVLSAVSRLLNRLATIFSEGRWTCASPAMAYLSLWLVVHKLGLTAMLVAFDESAFTTARAATVVVDDEGEYKQRVASRLGRSHEFLEAEDTPFSCVGCAQPGSHVRNLQVRGAALS